VPRAGGGRRGRSTLDLDTTAENVALAVGYVPGPNTPLWSSFVRFPRDAAGLCRYVAIHAREPGAQIVFDDEGPQATTALRRGSLDREDRSIHHDDFDMAFYGDEQARCSSSASTSRRSTDQSDDHGLRPGSHTSTYTLPDASSADAFIGVISDAPITYVLVAGQPSGVESR